MSVLVIGEALVDVVDGVRMPGGSPMNVALGLARLGVPTQLLTRIGRDADGELIRAHLDGVELLPASLRSGHTSTAVATIGLDGSASYEFDVVWDLQTVEASADWVHVGSIASFLAPGADAIEGYLRSFAGRVSYDPNIRPALMPADARERFERIASLAEVLKLSDEDAAWLYPDDADPLDRLLALGPAVVAVTRGAQGVTVATPEQRYDLPAVPVTVRDTIGAGDAFMAALIAELIADRPVDAAARTALAAAALTCERAGAQPPTRAELTARLP
jgi:fructokinase